MNSVCIATDIYISVILNIISYITFLCTKKDDYDK